ncbi:MAG TPA: hopanoid C-3 methylase HpnR [Tepidisphaeraceae bacterium]|jgi:magnesium-protoporphyrin IX monomethyl ester (oxidative) cyclase
MKVLLVHPSALLYSEVYLRLEPLGMECVAGAVERAGHPVRLLDLQVFNHRDFERELAAFAPDAIGFSVNYLANVPEVIDLARLARQRLANCFIFCGGHSISFVAEEVLQHADGAIDAIVKGEGEITVPRMLATAPRVDGLPGVVTPRGSGPRAPMLEDLNTSRPARHLSRRRRKYFIGELDPCASIEFSRGCPWDCSFCSAWTFYGRSYRQADPAVVADEMRTIREPNVFIVDDVAFIHPDHGMAIADELERRNVRKRYYLETRCDVLIRNQEVFARWAKLGLNYMFLGLESLDAGQLKLFRKRCTPNQNFEALEVARKLGIDVAINLITDPSWTVEQFRADQEWAAQVPEVVHLTVATPYPGTELFHTESRELTSLDYRLYDIQHAVVETRLPLHQFYQELVKTQAIINRKFMGWRTAVAVSKTLCRHLLHGQTNFLRMLFKFSKAYNADRFYADHFKSVNYSLRRPAEYGRKLGPQDLLVHVGTPASRKRNAMPSST